MSLDAELASWVALSLVPGLGSEGQRSLLRAFGSPAAIFGASAISLRQYVKPGVAEAIGKGRDEAALDVFADWLQQAGNDVVTLADSDYPSSLLNIADPPPLLYLKGKRELLNSPALAVVGSRNATAQGLRNAETFSQALGASGLTIVSGMAHGIDAAAHRGGLLNPASSIAVIGTGMDKVYPAANRDLAHLLAERGLLVSEFALGTPPLAPNFPRRNRIISGLGLGTLVVEASLQSGSLITARMSLEQGREVFAIPGSIHAPQAKGCHYLIKQGAKLVESGEDVLVELPQFLPAPSLPDVAAGDDHALYSYLGFDPVGLDALCLRSGLTIEALSAILLQLELEGRVVSLPGGLYQRVV